MKQIKRSRDIGFVSAVWVIMCIKLMLTGMYSNFNWIEYVLWSISCFYVVLKTGRRVSPEKIVFMKYFFTLMIIQAFGLLQISTLFSVRNIMASFCIGCFFTAIAIYSHSININIIKGMYYITVIFMTYRTIKGEKLGNTIPACIVYLTFIFILILMHDSRDRYKGKQNVLTIFKSFFLSIIAILLALYNTYIARSRAALLLVIIVVISFAFFHWVKLSARKMQTVFWVILGVLFLGVIIYINIRSFSWYQKYNVYSVVAFDKNIDSSRSGLWKESLESLKWWQVIFGAGTGKLPPIARYANSSFHNTYIQILMQNGLIGLACLLLLLYKIWRIFIQYTREISTQFILSVFVGILVYNCFECTLLQNKAFLGSFQWLILGMGIMYIYGKEKCIILR